MKLHAIAAASAALVFGAPVWAAASAQATLSNLTFTLYDLNPGDGIAAAVEFQTNGTYGSFVSATATDSGSGSQTGSRWSFSFLAPVSLTSSVGGTSATGSVSGDLSSGVTLSASGIAPGYSYAVPGAFSNSTSFAASARAGGADFDNLSFSLSPFTLLVIGGQTSLSATTTIGAKSSDFFFETEYASASLNLQVSGSGPTGLGGSQSSSDNASVYASFNYGYDAGTGTYGYIGESFTTERQVAVSFTNLSGASLDGNLTLSVSVGGSSPLPAVPEPGAMALLLAGLGVIGLRLRRQQAA